MRLSKLVWKMRAKSKRQETDKLDPLFLKFTLPLISRYKIIKVQSMIRGYLVRKFIYPKLKLWGKALTLVVDDMITKVVVNSKEERDNKYFFRCLQNSKGRHCFAKIRTSKHSSQYLLKSND